MKEAGQTQDGRPAHRRELLAAGVLLLLGVLPRILLAATHPAIAFSDFRALIEFGRLMAVNGWATPTWHWIQFNPGLAMILSIVFRVFPEHETAARLATALATGLLPLLPFFLWRPILGLRWRLLAGALLALWPGQIFFSGVVAQENWALLPTVALGALAVRVVRAPGGSASPLPIIAGLLLAAAVAFRQEMLVVLLPAAIAAAGLLQKGGRWRRAVWFGVSAGLCLAALAWQRQAASGRFALTTEHGGLALLGSVAPGAAEAGWVDPRAYIAAVEPDLLEDRSAARNASSRLALAEWKRRPAFHVARSLSVSTRLAVESDADSLYWSLGAESRGQALHLRLFSLLRLELALVQGLFFASVLFALRRRDAAILALAACVLLKFVLQSVASPLGRLMVPATALALLVVALGLASCLGGVGPESTPRRRGAFAFLTVVFAAMLLVVEPRWGAFVVSRDEAPLPVARFPLEIAGGAGHARCQVENGVVTAIEWRRAWLRPGGDGAAARVVCRVPSGAIRVEGAVGAATEALREDGALEITLEGAGPSGFALAPR